MALPDNPTITKFFVNKIESSSEDWPDYLLEIAEMFSMFDSQEYDRELLLDQFTTLSQRSPYTQRDSSNYRDEFGAYGTYLGLYRIEENSGGLYIYLTDAAKKYLCCTEPDVEAFCRTQLALFQYPNGAGAAYSITNSGNTSVRAQANALTDTLREINQNLRIVPFRLICRALLAKSQYLGFPLEDTEITYKELFALFNDIRTNTTPNPSFQLIIEVLEDLTRIAPPRWLSDKLSKFKRNFHILEQTGLLLRTSNGLKLDSLRNDKIEMVKSISEMTSFFAVFNNCNTRAELEKEVRSLAWGRYYDSAANLSTSLLYKITEVGSAPSSAGVIRESQPMSFPVMGAYDNSVSNTRRYSSMQASADPELTRLKREKANRDHARMVNMIATLARHSGGNPLENIFIDLYVDLNGTQYIFEMKSCNPDNVLAQIRKGISQLYEYRFRSSSANSILCLVLQTKPDAWLIEYLVKDRGIHCCWLVDEINFDCPQESRQVLNHFLG